MITSMRFSEQYLPFFGKNWRLFLLWGIALVVLGLVAISATTFTTYLSVVLLGFLIFLGGIIVLVDTFSFWWKRWGGFFSHLLMALLYIILGLMLINNPVAGSISLTLLLGIFYLLIGIFRIIFSSSLQLPKWGWSLFNGIITLILGILILASWPGSSLFVIGLFVGIDLVFLGWAYIITALTARDLVQR